ncbi:hypothetical protein WN51_11257 [Melipona quadrifasciata]|uniref:Uncharacterized protein n=1 Tax=Melipona quadrifasciata TaxID=166423 RepID=A0A0M9A5Y9_9HYME|nr:hypothetical protein WN51_11257 [Melipona quadrifasciata]
MVNLPRLCECENTRVVDTDIGKGDEKEEETMKKQKLLGLARKCSPKHRRLAGVEFERKKERQQLNSVTKAGEPNIDWRAVETTGCRGGYWFFIPIQRD